MLSRYRATIAPLFIAFVLVLAHPMAHAADIYVKASDDMGSGAKEAPYGALWRALERAVRGDVIHVAQGTYHSKGGSGAFVVKVPNLTLAGGYNGDFSVRNPFKYFTILERAEDYRGDWTGLPEGLIAGHQHEDHSGMVVDGFVLNSKSRNSYLADGSKILPKDSWKGELFHANNANIKILNCILLNPYGDGIYAAWQGADNEISNCFVLNTFYAAIETRSAQPGGVVSIKNNTILFGWSQPGKGGSMGVFVGRQGKTILENNIIGFLQTEGGEAGYAVSNTFGNDETVMKNNMFFQCQGGYYKYMDMNTQNLLMWKPDELEDLNENPMDYMLDEAEGNMEADPKLLPDKVYFDRFGAFVASEPGKLNMDFLNQWRASVGLPLQAAQGTARQNWGMAYPLEAVIPNLVSKLPGKGVQLDGPFAHYSSEAAASPAKDYVQVSFDVFKKGSPTVKKYQGDPVMFTAGLGQTSMTWLVASAPRTDYDCVKLLKPSETDMTRDYVYGYLLKGSPAAKMWDRLFKKRDNYPDGVTIKGTAWYAGNDNYTYPAGIIVDAVSK
ncbi:right-handed parallel beta-helix repeat-containing protein [Candidatus Fermentibacteria bacterium]|nr:right-handed parallel beta-helix repeat-containing protein [Candidatus Fermentibacteria bacterium]